VLFRGPQEFHRFENLEIPFQVNEKAIQELLGPEKETKKSLRRRRDQSTYETITDFDCYRTVKGTNDTMIQLELDYPDLVTIMDIGYSHRVYDPIPGEEMGSMIRLIKITSNNTLPQSDLQVEPLAHFRVEPINNTKSKLFIVAGVNVREYAPPEIALRFVEILVAGYGVNADITWILDHAEIYILPIANPDGRKIAESNRDLLWRKNEQ
jgi:hypothetical protein